MSIPITASMFYDLVHCPHRVRMALLSTYDVRDNHQHRML